LTLVGMMLLGLVNSCKDQKPTPDQEESTSATGYYEEAYRPQYHFSPEEKWMNDPNGLVYHQGVYHLFYQYYPEDIVWGPMHWGHAVSDDMVFWEHRPTALYPDENGLIFSGSAVVDVENSSGFGSIENPPIVAVFTYHNMEGEQSGRQDFQTQGIAYSLDNGNTWTKYAGNPVIGNEGIRDFRDPKVFWHEDSSSWIMVLVAGDFAKFYRSHNLKEWEFLSDFGKEQGAHGGVWECPDLFPLTVAETGETKWVLIISINPGAPNGGSGTQYFLGDFDGTRFISQQQQARWLDWGTDNYAGVTYNNTPNGERIFIGWMSNWDYARHTPTERWRSAMTLPRKLSLRKIGETVELINYPLEALEKLHSEEIQKELSLEKGQIETLNFEQLKQSEVSFKTPSRNFKISFKNALGETLEVAMDSEQQEMTLDRRNSGQKAFQEAFGNKIHRVPVTNLPEGVVEFSFYMDWSSLEVFVNGGQYVMTSQVFPNEPFNQILVENTGDKEVLLNSFSIYKMKSGW
ncbi:MAG: glycoside hydrolase family 32 protein, partial [Eudoraea sp.]|nr:glycoside hydrolase family 32 protein [Eudoraea sp.]